MATVAVASLSDIYIRLTFEQLVKIRDEIGFENAGNSCYVNSAMQAIFHLKHLTDWLESNEFPSCVYCGSTNKCTSKACAVSKTYADYVNGKKQHTLQSLKIHRINHLLGKNPFEDMQPTAADDAFTFVERAINAIHEECTENSKMDEIFGFAELGIVCCKTWENFSQGKSNMTQASIVLL